MPFSLASIPDGRIGQAGELVGRPVDSLVAGLPEHLQRVEDRVERLHCEHAEVVAVRREVDGVGDPVFGVLHTPIPERRGQAAAVPQVRGAPSHPVWVIALTPSRPLADRARAQGAGEPVAGVGGGVVACRTGNVFVARQNGVVEQGLAQGDEVEVRRR